MKQGTDYFPMDVRNDDKLDLIEAEFGIIGYAVIIKMYSRIYTNGYYTKWSNDEKLLFSKDINVSISEIDVIINKAIERDLFDKKLYNDYEILTSNGIQKRYLKITERRKSVEIVSEYWLNGINDNMNIKNVCKNKENDNINEQRKGKESKGNKSKEKESKEEQSGKPDLPPFSISLSELIFNHAGVKANKKQIEAGAKVISDINRIDSYSESEITSAIEWALSDEFWKRNVLSPASLRKKKNGAGDFTKFQKIYNQWKNKPLTDAEIAQQTIDRLNERERLRNEGKNVL